MSFTVFHLNKLCTVVVVVVTCESQKKVKIICNEINETKGRKGFFDRHTHIYNKTTKQQEQQATTTK